MKLYNGNTLHDERRIRGLHVIAHTGKVNSYARCQGSKLKKAISVPDAREIMVANITDCGGVVGGKKRTWTRKDGRQMTAS